MHLQKNDFFYKVLDSNNTICTIKKEKSILDLLEIIITFLLLTTETPMQLYYAHFDKSLELLETIKNVYSYLAQ